MNDIRKNKVYFTVTAPQVSLALLPLLSILSPTAHASAQVIAADDDVRTIVEVTSDRIDISGGQLSDEGDNLFQSFEQFDITAVQTARFATTPEVQNVVGKINGKASTINGTLQVSGSDANLYLMNPAGILLGPEAQLNLSGGFTATTATGINFENDQLRATGSSNYQNLTGQVNAFHFDNEQAGAVVNLGDLEVDAGQALNLIGGTVVNAGNLNAPSGSITVAAVEGENIVRLSQDKQLLSLEVDAQIELGSIPITTASIAEMVTGRELSKVTAIQTNPDGTVQLRSGDNVISEAVGSTIVSGGLSTLGNTGGNINVLGNQVSLEGATLDASGQSGGGLIRIGGDYRGQGPIVSASQTHVDEQSSLLSNAIDNGDGGRIIVWANETTHYAGDLSAQGGLTAGNGGFAEVSGKTELVFTGDINLSATAGEFGTLLLDPENIEITDGTPLGTLNTTVLSSAEIENLFNTSNVNFEATNNIIIHDISENDLRVNKGRAVTFTADSDGVSGGLFQMGLNDTIRAEQGEVTITGDGITAGIIRTHTNEHNQGGNSGVKGGDVTLVSTGGVIANEVLTYGAYTGDHHAPSGGSVDIQALGSDIDIKSSVETYSLVDGREAGTGGNITLLAQDNIRISTENPTSASVLQASSEARDHDSQGGGNISLTALTGDIDVAGQIESWSRARSSDGENNSDSGNGGNIILNANESIRTGNILSSTIANNNGAGNGGNITIVANNSVTTGLIENFSAAGRSNPGNGGNVTITANIIDTGMIDTSSTAGINNSGAGGDVILAAADVGLGSSINIAGSIYTYSQAFNNNAGQGGRVSLTSDSVNITSAGSSIDTTSIADENAGNGGNITINTTESLLISGELITVAQATDDDGAGNGGNIELSGNLIDIGTIVSWSSADDDAGNAGAVVITAQQKLLGNGIYAFSNGGGNPADISLVGDRINITNNGTAFLNGRNIQFQAATGYQEINIGDILRSPSGLDILESDLAAISSARSLRIGRADSTSTINLKSSLISSVGNRPQIEILGGDRIVGPDDVENVFRITGLGSGELLNAEVIFSDIKNLSGGSQNDSFEFISNGAIAGVIEGAAGTDTIDYSILNSTVNIDLENQQASRLGNFDTIENIIGSRANNDSIIGSNGDDIFQITDGNNKGRINEGLSFSAIEILGGRSGNDLLSFSSLPAEELTNWAIDRSNSGNVRNLRFENFQSLEGGEGNDTFSFINNGQLTGRIIGNGGDNTLDYTNSTSTPITIDLNNQSATGVADFRDIGIFVGSSHNADSIRGSNADDTFSITGSGSGNINRDFSFSSIERLDGRTGNDTLDYGAYNPGAEGIRIDLGMMRATDILEFNNIESIIGSSGEDQIIGSTRDDTFTMTGQHTGNINGTLAFTNIETIDGNLGQDTLEYSSHNTPIEISLEENSVTGLSNFTNVEAIIGSDTNNDKIIGSIEDDVFEMIGSDGGIANSSLSFASIETIDGNSGTDELNYSRFNTAIEINLENKSATNVERFENIENVVGSSASEDRILGSTGDDTFLIAGDRTGNINGTLAFSDIEIVDGNAGTDRLDYSSYTTPIEVMTGNSSATGISEFQNIEEITGSNADNDKVIGSSNDDTFEITGNSAGRINNTLSFKDIEEIDGATGTDGLDYSSYSTPIEVNIGSRKATGVLAFSSIETVIGSSANTDSLIGSTNDDSFKITGEYTGNVNNQVSFLAIEELDGGNGEDSLDYSDYRGSFEISFGEKEATGIEAFSSIESIIGNSEASGVIEGFDDNNQFVITGDRKGLLNGIAFTNISEIRGEGSNNTLAVDNERDLNTWLIDEENSGSLNGLLFQGINNLVGSKQNDIFSFTSGSSLSGNVAGGDGTDTLTYADYGEGITIDIARMSATGLASFQGIENIVASNLGTDQVLGSANNDTFKIIDRGRGRINNMLSFSNIETLNGQDGKDVFDFGTLASPSNLLIIGGGLTNENFADNRMVNSAPETVWEIDGKNQGQLRQGSTVLARFSDIQNLENNSNSGIGTRAQFTGADAEITGSINSGSRDLSLVGNTIGSASLSGTGTLTISPENTSADIVLGGTNEQDAALNITNTALNSIQQGFRSILIGGERYTGGIRAVSDISFQASVMLRSQADIDTRGGQIETTNGNLTLQTNGAIRSDRLGANNGALRLEAQSDIAANRMTAKGQQGIDLTSRTGSVTVSNLLDSSSSTRGHDIRIVANGDINTGQIISSGGGQGGDVNLTSTLGSITTGGITTTNRDSPTPNNLPSRPGNVSLRSPGNIQISFIDARSSADNTDPSRVDIETQGKLSITESVPDPAFGLLQAGASISTRGANGGDVSLRYGSRDRFADLFQIGSRSNNGTTFRIETPETAIIAGEFFSSYQQANVELINRGILPPNISITSANKVTALGFPKLSLLLSDTAIEDNKTFQQVEANNEQEFRNYLSLPSTGESKQPLTLYDVKNTLGDIEKSTNTTPALVYAYYVPDAAEDEETAIGSDRTTSPDDQLEVMLVTSEGTPIRKRQWGITRAQVEAASETLRQQVTSQFSSPQQYLQPAQQLYNWLISPIEEALQERDIQSIGFVMDTGLRTLPLSTLHDGNQYLVENYSLGLLPSFSLTDIDSTRISHEQFENTKVLAMGASEFQNQSALPAVSEEISLITEKLWEGDAFLNRDFVLKNLQEQLQQEDYGIVHLATHAIFESGDLDKSYIQLWEEKLYLNQLSELELDQEDISLIILSACNTALGDHNAEYGFAGLAVGAGSPSALASLWPISDEGTLGFMTQFYSQLKEAPVRTEALRQAQLKLINGEVGIANGTIYGPDNEEIVTLETLEESGHWNFSHPFYWSPFTMIGNPW
ncbi:MAG: CHAT domain-containing protein [Cyanobacteria bacterium J06634_5]